MFQGKVIMKFSRITLLFFLCLFAFLYVNAADAKDNQKIGFGYDRSFGIAVSLGQFNGFIGNSGIALDRVVKKNLLDVEIEGPVYWYFSVGGFLDWNNGLGARLPVGVNWYFAENLDAYLQLIPTLKVIDKTQFGLGSAIVVRYKF